MLRDLFDGTGVMSALDHTKIEGANDPESLSVDAQAAKVAKRAADALRRSQAQVQVRCLSPFGSKKIAMHFVPFQDF